MQAVKRSFGFLWALWGGLWFMLIITVFTILYALLFLVTGTRYVRQCIWINCRYLCNALRYLSFVRKRVHGLERMDRTRNYVFVANHTTQFDTIVSASSLPHAASFLAKAELKKVPVFGYMIRMLAYTVDRKNKESREKSIRNLVSELQKGNSIFVFPEGTRNRTENPLMDFKDGAFGMAVMSGTPIIVQTLVGMKKINPPQGIQLYPGVVDVYWSDPIETKGMTVADIPALKQRVRDEMLKYLG